jgi:hypothetical protein
MGDTPAPTLRTYALATLAALVGRGPAGASESPELEFLAGQRRAAVAEGTTYDAALRAYLARPAAIDEPLLSVARDLGLTTVEVLAVALAAAVDEDLLAGRAIAYLQSPVGGARPTLGLLSAALTPVAASAAGTVHALVTGAAARSGLLTLLGGEGTPLPERAVAVPLALCLALRGQDWTWPDVTIGLGDVPEVPLPPSVVKEAERQARGLQSGPEQALVVRTLSAAEGQAVAATIARALHRRALFVHTDKPGGLAPWAMLRQLLPVFCFDLAPGERRMLPSLPFFRGPVLALCGPDGRIEAPGGAVPSWSLQVPGPQERRALWGAALGNPDLAADLARDYRHGAGRIAHLGRLVRHRAALDGQPAPTRDDVVAASWSGEGGGLDALAQPLRDPISDTALVVPVALRRELDVLVSRCRLREGLATGLGASAIARYQPGVRALFVGPSGTGKTLAAGWLATRLGLPLYRVDLASVTSKYIGETEKNLAQLLARAEQAEVVLLFDEADSLFGKRTDVKDANDRFANSQTNYLLQRIESFDGITILTSNSRTRLDPAFTRRLDMIVDFPLPGPEERRELWRSHLGTGHRLTLGDLNQLAAAADLTGGHIRNAVFAAAAISIAHEHAIEYGDVVQGLASEYKKLGRQLPAELRSARESDSVPAEGPLR